MFEINKKYWLYIFPYIYYCNKREKALLYNTLTGETIETDKPSVIDLLLSMHERKNLGALVCEGSFFMQNDVSEFITEFCEKKMGNIADMDILLEKPIQLMPVLNLQCDIDKKRDFETDILQNLLELNFHISNECSQACHYCNKYFRQTHCCSTNISRQKGSLDISTIKNVLSQIQYGVVGKINILGGNILLYPNLLQLKSVLEDFNDIVHFYIHYNNFDKNDILNIFHTELIVNFPINKYVFNEALAGINKEKSTIHFIIENEEEYAQVEQITEKYNISKYTIKPFFNEQNIGFFKNNIFIDKEDLSGKPLQMREIFINQKINSYHFGVLHILQDGSVKANSNTKTLGNIKKDKIMDLIYKEMLENTAWRKIRDSQPCIDCVYQWLCPSPSNYERAIGKPNLCHIKV